MATVELQVRTWQERGIQVMVLLSFTMQVMLLVLAEFRRRMDSGVLRALVWSAYMLADTTAIYTLGHLSVTSRSSDHELMAFWAPFLLVHLGGQDNITAYAIEDNRLWLRHLQVLAVQVAAAAYVLYESTVVGSQALLQKAAALMFVVGVLKYGERVWALKRAGTSASGHKYQYSGRTFRASHRQPPADRCDTDGLLMIAHLMMDIPKELWQGPLSVVAVRTLFAWHIHVDALYKVVEMQLSLMHDLVYSKAEVVHTWYGLCIRVISPVFTVIAFVLFQRSGLSAGGHQYSRADIVITYVLLAGAVMLEMVSVLRAIFSRWSTVGLGMLSYDFRHARERRVWGMLARVVMSIRRFVLGERDGSRWWWSCSMGQHNMLNLCVRSRASRASRIMGWMGLEDWWNTMIYSSSIPVSTTIKLLVLKQVQGSSPGKSHAHGWYSSKHTDEEPDHIINSQGRAALKKWGSYERLGRFVDMELDESILVWHIATDIYLRRWRKDEGQAANANDVLRLAEATEAISNYMLFLLAARPYMLPDSVGRTRYVNVCYCLTALKYRTVHDLAGVLTSPWFGSDLDRGVEHLEKTWLPNIHNNIYDDDTLEAARDLASELITPRSGTPTELAMLAEVWTEILCYAGYRCSGYSHTKQLSNGGELLTVAALLVEYYRRDILHHLSREEEIEEEEKERRAQPTRIEPRSPSSGSSDEISPV